MGSRGNTGTIGPPDMKGDTRAKGNIDPVGQKGNNIVTFFELSIFYVFLAILVHKNSVFLFKKMVEIQEHLA